ncbi:hypothetical protein LDL57_08200 [Arsenophonus apicola]|nr:MULTISPECIES: hypothetical protein [Arsenophonus]UBX27876.1 hypothetical protein LDL57_08200 [Arsenophonus apicola]
MTVIQGAHTYFKQNGTVLISSSSSSSSSQSLPPFQVSDLSQWVNNALRENIRGKDKIKKWKDSYDIDQAAQQIIRQHATWNSEHQIGQAAAVTYSFSRWHEYYNAYYQLTEYQQLQAKLHWIAGLMWLISLLLKMPRKQQILILVIFTALKVRHLLIYLIVGHLQGNAGLMRKIMKI